MYRLRAPELSAQDMTAPTGRPSVIFSLLPDAPPRLGEVGVSVGSSWSERWGTSLGESGGQNVLISSGMWEPDVPSLRHIDGSMV